MGGKPNTKQNCVGMLCLHSKLLSTYNDYELSDLINYFNPSLILLTDVEDPKLPGRLCEQAECKILAPGISKKMQTKEFGDLTFISVPSTNELSQLEEIKLTSWVCIINDFVKPEMDISTFQTKITGLKEYIQTISNIDADKVHHIGTKHETDISDGDITIKGVGKGFSMGADKVSFVEVRDAIHIRKIDSSHIGMRAIYDLSYKMEQLLRISGIKTRRELMKKDPHELLTIRGIGPYRASVFPTGARANEENTVYRFMPDSLNNDARVFIDIETDSLMPTIIWQIGVFDERTGEYRCFIAENPRDKEKIIKEFADWAVNETEDATFLSWYGAHFDFVYLGKFIEKYNSKNFRAWEKIEKVDLLKWVKETAAVPSRSFKLDEVATVLGYDWQIRGLDGKQVGELYSEWAATGKNEPNWEELKIYCEDDVLSMKHVYDTIASAKMLIDKSGIEKSYRH